MTNAQIIFNARMALLEQGAIEATGRMLTVYGEDGDEQIPEPEELHTYAAWKSMGFQVRRGEKAKAAITIWIPRKGKKGEKEDSTAEGLTIEASPDMLLKKSYFFSASQVDRVLG